MQDFVHTPLQEPDPDADTREIRVLTLCCGQPGADIHIAIEKQVMTSGLRDEQSPDDQHWEALSYTWGSDAQPRRNIIVDTDTGPRAFDVRENLHSALQQLRFQDQHRRLWIDAICMDQSDTERARREKGWQIPVMHEIYGAASRTVIWLGDAYEDSDYAIAFLRTLGQSFVFNHVTYEAQVKQWGVPARILELHQDWRRFSWKTREHKSACALFLREWFGRVWTRQEAFAAADSGIIICGSASIGMLDFRNAIQYLSARGLDVSDPDHVQHLDRLGLVLSMVQREYSSIYNIMDRIRVSQCREPQDKIYGCLGMIKIATGSAFASSLPTHYPPAPELFQEFFLQYFYHFGTVRLLRDAGISQRSIIESPSWVPNWLEASPTKLDLSLECATSHGLRAEAEYIKPDVLRVKGCFAANIIAVEAMQLVKDSSSGNFDEAYTELARLMKTHMQLDDMSQIQNFARALCCPLSALRVPLEQLEDKRQDILVLTEMVMHSSNGSVVPAPRLLDHSSLYDFQSCIRFIMQHQLPFVFTDDGHVGLGVEGTQAGDMAAAVLGTTNLFLLRPAGRHGHHHLVGSCFMHGYNWGEALLGPLPAGVTVVPQLNPQRGVYNPHYCNVATGRCTFWDPRIDWDVLTPSVGEAAWMIGAPPGEPQRKVPTSEYFIRHHNSKIVDILLL